MFSYNLDVLQEAVQRGIIDTVAVQEKIEMAKNEEIIKHHKENCYSIWQGKDGKWYTNLPDEEKGKKRVKRTTEAAINQVVIDFWKNRMDTKTLESVFEEWMAYKAEYDRTSASTLMRYRQIYNRHFGGAEMRKTDVKKLSAFELEKFIKSEIVKQNLDAKAFSNLRTIVKGILKFAKKNGYTAFNVSEFFEELEISPKAFSQTVKEAEEEVFDEAETEKIVRYLVQNLDVQNLGILLMFATGIRVGELAGLKHEDFSEHSFRIRRTETRFKREGDNQYSYEIKDFPKTEAGARTVVLPEEFFWLEGKLKALNPFGDFIFTNAEGRMTTTCFRNRLRRICEKLGIRPKSPHKIRKTYATILLDNGLDSALVEELMGHTDISTTKRHYHRNRVKQAKKIEILSAIPDFEVAAPN